MPLLIETATAGDAEEILHVQKTAYEREARIYDDWSIPPLTQTSDQMRADIARLLVLKACLDGVIVGSVRARLVDGTCEIGRLCVLPAQQGRGIGASLLREIEGRFPQAHRFELFTGERSEANLRFYARSGYRAFRRAPLGDAVTVVYLEKPAGPAPARD